MMRRNIIIIGAAGRDFHNFNTRYRHDATVDVKAFTAAQIPDIDDRRYPAQLAGSLYPKGIPIHAEVELPSLIRKYNIDECVFSYSDVPYSKVMNLSALVNAEGSTFSLLGPKETQIKSTKPVIAICAVRTGSGKSQTSRKVVKLLSDRGLKVVTIRHPMPYGDLVQQKVQRFAAVEDLAKHNCTIEEMEEYEPHISRGNVIFAGVDYEAILREAEKEADIIVWDGGNNDFPFYVSDLMITVADPLRPGHETSFYPGEASLRMADVVVINKIDSADPDSIQIVRENIALVNPEAQVIEAASPIEVDRPELIRGKRVLCIEDGPTLTHGMMKFGAGVVAAKKYHASHIVDPRPWVVGKLAETFLHYPEIGSILPAMGYGKEQIADLQKTIDRVDCDTVIIATPIDLRRVVNISKPTVKVGYNLQEIGNPDLNSILNKFFDS
jgi:predicted GTPase